MNYISILIVDDDLNKISVVIETIKEVYSETLSISQASNVQEAIEVLQKDDFHLLITDLLMPLKFDSEPDKRGGESLVKSLYRKKTNVNVPMYIAGLTQFKEIESFFNPVWQVLHYDSSLEDWKIKLRDLISHISSVKSRILANKIETLFVEGPTDKKILADAIKHFFPNLIDKIYINTINYGGWCILG
jgi:CheY-like chemotaxis protein